MTSDPLKLFPGVRLGCVFYTQTTSASEYKKNLDKPLQFCCCDSGFIRPEMTFEPWSRFMFFTKFYKHFKTLITK